MAAGLISGGPVALVYGFILAYSGTIAMALSLSEAASMIPSAGGQYHYVAELSPSSIARPLSWAAGWVTMFGWQSVAASAPFLAGTMIQGLIVLNEPSYIYKRWHGTLLYWAVLVLSLAVNVLGIRILPHVENASMHTTLSNTFRLGFLLTTSPVKCDETKPSCRQCALKSLECPGYAPRWKWSTKHERRSGLQIRRAPVSKKARAKPSASGSEDITPEVDQQESVGTDWVDHLQHVESITEDLDTGDAVVGAEAERALLNEDWDNVTFQASTSRSHCITTPGQPCFALAQWSWQPSDTILSNVQVQVDFFSQQVCKALTAIDSMNNPFRRVALSRTKDSLLFFSLCRYLTAAFLNSSASDATSASVVQNAQTETLQRLHSAVAQLDMLTRTKVEDILMAIIMFGLRIYEARRTLLKRLQSIREILPYSLLELVQELVLKTWDAGDKDNPEVFWIDVMIENESKFLLV
ncbi:hypothetical protein G647_04809 [Cladophialophora carrionii CBS 160.54]|uniref:Zn(2)-C6 fungal-type domain-containing protein n=1 Tax=Cladophialophora carrionii CBS 160.54 TaxID=1279043 RepID=V9D9P0_9EURO|nr:uncharacterized protein G647_04809 [Cladophialophora carrionii CBS 160.54]ETI23013.1 hypothetical protein G647_04809 [Cladophialophora carrionii CBS 160.54]